MSLQGDFERLFDNKISHDEGVEFLRSLYEKTESSDDIYDAMQVMRSRCIPFEVDDELRGKLLDNCGTGGDKLGAFNISTTVSFVLAGAGEFVAKHGNRSITSRSGSADMLEVLGFNLNLPPQKQLTMLQETGFAFLFAQLHHPAMKHIMPIRKALPHRNIFNLLGPLTNPAGVKRHFIGVFDYSFAMKMAVALQKSGSKCGMVISSKSGMDEAALHEPSMAVKFDQNTIQEISIDPQSLGIKIAPLSCVLGADALENAKITMQVLGDEADTPKTDIVLLNAALALYGCNSARDVQEGLEMARHSIKSGKAKSALQSAIKLSNTL